MLTDWGGGSDSPLHELVQPLVCSDCHIGLGNETSLLLPPIDKLGGAPPGLSLSGPPH